VKSRSLHIPLPSSDTLGAVALELLPQKAAVLHLADGRRVLLVADVHLGKTAAFAAGGVPLRADLAGELARADLQVLASLVACTRCDRLVVLGDLLHARTARDPGVLEALQAWRRSPVVAGLELVLVRGNHDLGAGDPPDGVGFRCVDAPWEIAPGVMGVHEPCQIAGAFVVGGHLHPGVLLAGARVRARAPCFIVGERLAVLPAFGRFTGSMNRNLWPEARRYACGPESVVEVPTARVVGRVASTPRGR
jgi:DNA ligase-associated metallophosphoesterase